MGNEIDIVLYSPMEIKKWYFQFIEALTHAFHSLDFNVICIYDKYSLDSIKNEVILIVIGSLGDPKMDILDVVTQHTNFKIILYETVPVVNPPERRYYKYKPISIWTFCYLNIDILKMYLSIPICYVPPSYSIIYDYRSDISIECRPITLIGIRIDLRFNKIMRYIPEVKNISAWTHDDFKKNVIPNHILIGIHKFGFNHLTMFRFAPLLSSGMRIISEPTYYKDMEMLKDLITFSPVHEMKKIVDSWKNEDHNKISQEISTKFRQRFKLTRFY